MEETTLANYTEEPPKLDTAPLPSLNELPPLDPLPDDDAQGGQYAMTPNELQAQDGLMALEQGIGAPPLGNAEEAGIAYVDQQPMPKRLRRMFSVEEKLSWLAKLSTQAVKQTARELAQATGISTDSALSNIKHWRKQKEELEATANGQVPERKYAKRNTTKALLTLFPDLQNPANQESKPGDSWSASQQFFTARGCTLAASIMRQGQMLQGMTLENAIVLALTTINAPTPTRGDELALTARGLLSCGFDAWHILNTLERALPPVSVPAPQAAAARAAQQAAMSSPQGATATPGEMPNLTPPTSAALPTVAEPAGPTGMAVLSNAAATQ